MLARLGATPGRAAVRDWAAVLALGGLAVLVLGTLDSYTRFLVGQSATLIIVTLGLTMLVGAAGQLSLASASFLAFGAYGVVIFSTQVELPILLAAAIAIVAAGGVGWLLGLTSLRLEGFYLAIVTFGFVQVVYVLLIRGGSITGEALGLVAPVDIDPETVAQLVVFAAVLLAGVTAALLSSRYGRAWRALKHEPAVAALQGINVARMKTLAFAISAMFAATAGAFQALLLGSVNPQSFTVPVSIEHLAAVVVGGLTGTVAGAIVAPLILFLMPELLPSLGTWKQVLNGALLLVVIAVFPRGLGGLIGDLAGLARRAANAVGVGSRVREAPANEEGG